jgi:surfactin synthase thioesterase subunit
VTELHTDRWVRRFHQAPAGAPQLLCFPHAGGAANYFFRLSAALQPDVQVLGVQYPGRQERMDEPLVDDLVQLAERIAAALPGRPDRPTAFLGHSMGAVVGYEVARRWEAQGSTIEHLLASGRRAPSDPKQSTLHQRDDAGFLAGISEFGGPAFELLTHPELGPILLPPVRNDYKAIETYRHPPGPPLSCPITVLVGDSDPLVTPAEAQEWAAHTTGAFQVRVFGGGHFFLTDHQRQVTHLVRRALISS